MTMSTLPLEGVMQKEPEQPPSGDLVIPILSVEAKAPSPKRKTLKIVRCTHSKHLLANWGAVFRLQAADRGVQRRKSTPRHMKLPLYDVLLDDPELSPSTTTIGVGVTPEEADAMYQLSADTKVIDRFISHSWSAPRLFKWLALCDVYHRFFALICAAAWWIAASAIGIYVRLHRDEAQSWPFSLTVFLLIPAAIFLYAFLAQGPDALGSTCYLDKLCVHQADGDRKLAGISSLGDCLRASRNLTILWSDDYFERLWCVFEMATFVSKASNVNDAMKHITIKPLWVPPFYLGVLGCNMLVMLFVAAVQSTTWFEALFEEFGQAAGAGIFWVFTSLGPAFLTCWTLRHKSIRLEAMLSRLASFKLDEAKVTVERDRLIVYKQVNAMFGSTARFEEYVRTQFHDAVVRRVGEPYTIHYVWAVIIFQPFIWYSTVDTVCISPRALEAQVLGVSFAGYAIVNCVYYTAQALVVNPLVLQAVSVCQRLSRQLRRGPALFLDVFVYECFIFVLNTALLTLIGLVSNSLSH